MDGMTSVDEDDMMPWSFRRLVLTQGIQMCQDGLAHRNIIHPYQITMTPLLLIADHPSPSLFVGSRLRGKREPSVFRPAVVISDLITV